MASLMLYHIAPSRSSTALWMLEEVGEPYEIKLLRMSKEEQRKPEYLAINPMGKVPALIHDGALVTECAAICAYLADAFPAKGLAPATNDKRRGSYYRWLFFGPSALEPAMIDKWLQRSPAMRQALSYGDFDTAMDVAAQAVATGPYVLGDQFTAADVVLGATLRFGMHQKIIPEKPQFQRYVDRLNGRPAYQRAFAKDQELSKA